MTRLELAVRGLVMPSLVTCNVVAVQRRSVLLVFVLGVLISFVWSGSVRAITAATVGERCWYWLAAGVGSVLGMVVGAWLAA